MRFSEAFSISDPDDHDWFDRHLKIDTPLFVDPLLLLDSGGRWAEAHDELIAHFAYCYRLVANATSKDSVSAQTARKLLKFPEPYEFGLGYTAEGTDGSGAGNKAARTIADGIAVAIGLGITVPKHIEEIGIFNEGVGADIISDAACNVLKHRFILYTQEEAAKLEVPLDQHKVRNTSASLEHGRWRTETVALPTNPLTKKPVILVPRAILGRLPVLNASSWFDSDINADVRNQMNTSVSRRVSKSDIVRSARRNAGNVIRWAGEQESRQDLKSYNFDEDQLGVYQWDQAPAEFARSNPIEGLSVPDDEDSLVELVQRVIAQFKHFVEEQRGWSLLYGGKGEEKPEEAAQLLFLGCSQPYLRQFGVELDREVELGRGPVDFKVSNGSRFRCLIEVKKVQNGKFWNGLEAQLPSYMTSDQCNNGWFVAIQQRSEGSSRDRVRKLPAVVGRLNERTRMNVRSIVVDARPKDSASKLHRPEVVEFDPTAVQIDSPDTEVD